MSATSPIEWTDATWNPIVGCTLVSPGCTHCYAMRHAARIERMNPGCHYAGTTKRVNRNPVWSGKIALAPNHLMTLPLSWRKPKRVFVNSMGDLFHEDVPDEWIDRVFAVMALAPQHTFQVLTKRAGRMREYVCRFDWDAILSPEAAAFTGDIEQTNVTIWPLPNVWLGVSAEDQTRADERIPHLLQTPAAVRFVSAEPLLGPIDLTKLGDATMWLNAFTGAASHLLGMSAKTLGTLDWVIVGGESGAKARPMHPDWARSLRDQCAAADVPFFFKQWGAWGPHKPKAGGDLGDDVRRGTVRIVHPTGQSDVEVSIATGGRSTIPGSRYMARVGKKAAGRLLDGVEHNAMPVRT